MPYPVVDLHCDTIDRLVWQKLPAEFKTATGDDFYFPGDAESPETMRELARNHGHISLAGIGDTPWAQCFACYIPDELSPEQALRFYRFVQDFLAGELEKLPQVAEIRSGSEIRPAIERGGVTCIRTIENARLFAHDPALVDELAGTGVLMASLSWNAEGPLASGHDVEGADVTPVGLEVMRRMERAGMALDVSHLNDVCFDTVVRATERPFVASHSNSRTVCGHPRNLTDAQFAEIRDRGGIVGLNYCDDFLRYGGNPTFDDLSRHIDHMLELGGEDVLALGSDFDGCDTPAFIADAAAMPSFQKLLEGRFGEELTAKICYRNACDFFERWERESAR